MGQHLDWHPGWSMSYSLQLPSCSVCISNWLFLLCSVFFFSRISCLRLVHSLSRGQLFSAIVLECKLLPGCLLFQDQDRYWWSLLGDVLVIGHWVVRNCILHSLFGILFIIIIVIMIIIIIIVMIIIIISSFVVLLFLFQPMSFSLPFLFSPLPTSQGGAEPHGLSCQLGLKHNERLNPVFECPFFLSISDETLWIHILYLLKLHLTVIYNFNSLTVINIYHGIGPNRNVFSKVNSPTLFCHPHMGAFLDWMFLLPFSLLSSLNEST